LLYQRAAAKTHSPIATSIVSLPLECIVFSLKFFLANAAADPLQPITEKEKELLWKYREHALVSTRFGICSDCGRRSSWMRARLPFPLSFASCYLFYPHFMSIDHCSLPFATRHSPKSLIKVLQSVQWNDFRKVQEVRMHWGSAPAERDITSFFFRRGK